MAEITVTVQVREIVYDIQNKTYLMGQAHEADGSMNYEAASNMQASNDEENVYQIKRSISNAFASLKSLLGEYISEDTSSSNNLIENNINSDGQLELKFSMPANFNKSSVDSIGDNVHAYLVDVSLAEWFTITSKTDVEAYLSHSVASLENIKRALHKRSRPSRPSYS